MSFNVPLFKCEPFVGQIKFLHSDKADASSAYSVKETATLALIIPRKIYVNEIRLSFYDESLKKKKLTKRFLWYSADKSSDEYRASFKPEALGIGLYFSSIKVATPSGEFFGRYEDALIKFTNEQDVSPNIQLTVSDFLYPEPDSFYGGIIYHVFVDRFMRSGKVACREDALIVNDWSGGVPEYPEYPGAPLKNNTFYGGTLYGVADKLDYISSLGANIIYLSPIFEAASNHKYDTGDYMRVDEMFGGDKALRYLIKQCKKRGIKLILDGVFNHTGADSIYFNRYGRYSSVGAFQSEDSEYRTWYSFESFPEKYSCWWGIEILPRLNLSEPACREYFIGDGGVIEKYFKMGIDGIRLDVADELSDEFISGIKRKASENVHHSIVYGEVWEDASNKIAYDTRKKYYLGSELDGVMNYPLRKGLIDYIKFNRTHELRYALTDIIRNAPLRVSNAQMNLIGTHDTERILTVLGGDSSDGFNNSELRVKRMDNKQRANALKLLSSMYTVVATLPGLPTVFYGDEAGLEGYGDPFNRMPYPWGQEDTHLLDHYKKVGAIRRKNKVFGQGSFKLLHLDDGLLVFERAEGGNAFLTILNNSMNSILVSFSGRVLDLLCEIRGTEFTLKPKETKIFKTKKDITLKTIDLI